MVLTSACTQLGWLAGHVRSSIHGGGAIKEHAVGRWGGDERGVNVCVLFRGQTGCDGWIMDPTMDRDWPVVIAKMSYTVTLVET